MGIGPFYSRAAAFERNASRKRPCPTGTLYCVRCRKPRVPGGGMADYLPITSRSGNLHAIYETCGTLMHRRTRAAEVAMIPPGIDVRMGEASGRLIGKSASSPDCDSGNRGAP